MCRNNLNFLFQRKSKETHTVFSTWIYYVLPQPPYSHSTLVATVVGKTVNVTFTLGNGRPGITIGLDKTGTFDTVTFPVVHGTPVITGVVSFGSPVSNSHGWRPGRGVGAKSLLHCVFISVSYEYLPGRTGEILGCVGCTYDSCWCWTPAKGLHVAPVGEDFFEVAALGGWVSMSFLYSCI
jgi:hypothetical protein